MATGVFAECHRDETALLLIQQQTHRLWRRPPEPSKWEEKLPGGNVDHNYILAGWQELFFFLWRCRDDFFHAFAFTRGQDASAPACFTLLAADFWAWGWGWGAASSTLSWNAVDFLNPHQSILGLRGRAYLKPPFPHELGLESVSEQLAGWSPPPHSSFVFCRCWSTSKMEEDVADEEKECSHGKGNELVWKVIWLAEKKVRLLVKNRTGSAQESCDCGHERVGVGVGAEGDRAWFRVTTTHCLLKIVPFWVWNSKCD